MKARVVDRPPVPRLPEDPKLVRLLYEQLGSVRAVARHLDRGTQLVRDLLRDEGVVLRNEGSRDADLRGLYVSWRSMIRRCDEPSHRSFPNYGARSIGYTPTWATFSKFREWALKNWWRAGMSLLLVDSERDHSPKNCRWAGRAEMLQLRARVRSLSPEPVRAFGQEKSAWNWAQDPRCRVSYMGLLQRLRRGWPGEEAMILPNRAPAPALLVRPREVHRMQARVNWRRVLAMHGRGRSIAEIASTLGRAYSTIYLGLEERGVLARRGVRRTKLQDGSLYGTWCRMRRACRGNDVGRRGTGVPTMAGQWKSYSVFRDWARSQQHRRGQCLVRTDPKRPYGPSNCLLVDRSDVIFHAQPPKKPLGRPRYLLRGLGTAKGLAEWSRDPRCTVTLSTIRRRILAGWSVSAAITDPPARPGSAGHPSREATAFAQTKGLADWARDRRCKVTLNGLTQRLDNGVDPEVAIRTPPFELRAEEARKRGRPRLRGRRRPRREA